jgi:hypothetical protein
VLCNTSHSLISQNSHEGAECYEDESRHSHQEGDWFQGQRHSTRVVFPQYIHVYLVRLVSRKIERTLLVMFSSARWLSTVALVMWSRLIFPFTELSDRLVLASLMLILTAENLLWFATAKHDVDEKGSSSDDGWEELFQFSCGLFLLPSLPIPSSLLFPCLLEFVSFSFSRCTSCSLFCRTLLNDALGPRVTKNTISDFTRFCVFYRAIPSNDPTLRRHMTILQFCHILYWWCYSKWHKHTETCGGSSPQIMQGDGVFEIWNFC